MENLSFKLEVFEGPLDLLLHLIQKNKVSIYDIPIALITDQYFQYIDVMEENDIELSSEFVVMASRLLYIKSKLLLPVHSEEEEEEDPRQELIQNLAEYKKYKEISSFFNDRKNICDFLYFKEPEQIDELAKPVNNTVDISKLMSAFENIMLRAEKRLPPSKKAFNGIVGREPVPVKSKIKSITTKIKRKGKVRFEELFDDAESRSEIVAIFLAVLELLRNREIGIKTTDNQIILGEIDGNL